MFHKTDFDLCIIGGGAAGLVAAAGAAGLGARAVLIDNHRLGGDCLYTGCVPSKALLHQAMLVHTARQAVHLGMEVNGHPDLAAIHNYVQSVIKQIEPHDSPERFRDLGVEVIFGDACFLDKHTVTVGNSTIRARNFVLATGSRPSIPMIPGLNTVPYFTNETIFNNAAALPELVILGAGPIGLEMAQAHQRLGSQVTVLDLAPAILPREDPDLADVVRSALEGEGVKFLLGQTTSNVWPGSSASDASINFALTDATGKKHKLGASHLLVATGRLPNIENLGLDKARVETKSGRLILNRKLQTTNKRVYACGDVAGPYNFTHMAEHQAGVVLRNTLFHLPAKSEDRLVSWSTFTDPELARVGLSETEAINQNIEHQAITFPFSELDRARTDNQSSGHIKVVVNKKGKILGAAIAGKNAGELIHEYVLAMKQKLKLGQLAGVIHIYPTLSQINRRVADTYLKTKLTPARKKLLKFLFRLRGS
jgi:pyruvate/2-oxoglutarate dehydrogenase complex dihydrolipoamide dehydrogenase (E3) component